MSAVKVLFLILLWQMSFLHNEALVVVAPSPHKAQLGENVVLPCSFKVDDPSINLQFLAILWLFQGKEVLRFDNKGTSSQSRMFINKQDIPKGIANIEIKNVTISDIGKYRCMVIYSPQKESKDIDLNVYATPSVMIEKVEKEDKTSFALCSVIGFYPRDITVEILQDRTIIEDSILSAYHTNADGTYSVNRTWKIPTDVSPKMLSCSVHHETLSPSVQKDLQLVYQGDSDNTVVVVSCVVGVIVLILVLVSLWYYKRKSDHQKFMVKDIESPGCIVGEKTTLCCEAFNCTGDVMVTWIIKLRDGIQHEISDMGSSDKEEEQPLMSREYQVTKEHDTQKMKGHLTTKLTFIPSISRHVGSTVSCRIVHQKKPVEKTFEVKSIQAKPQFIEPVQFTLSDQGDVQISVTLQKFYPPEMAVEWVSKKGQSEEQIKSEVTKSNSGDTVDLESKCSVSGELFKDPSYKVIVRWKHESMKEPQSREMSVRDLPWHPKLQKFPIECVFQGEEVILQCRVSDYFPDVLAVKWFERKMDSQDMVEISSSQKYKIPEISSYRMENKTISSTAVLSYKRFDLTEKGVEFICTAEHPSLDTPIQTSIIQYRDTDAPTFVLNNIQGPQIWFSGEKVTLYCAASYCMEGTQIIWMVKESGVAISEIGEDGADVNRDSHQSSGYVAHRERTEESDKEGLQDVTSSLTFTPSITTHQNISIACKILCDRKVKEKTFQRKYFYAKPTASGPIKLSLTDSGEVLCSLDIDGFYPSDIQVKWNDKTSEPNRTSQNSDGTYKVHSEYKLPGSFFSHPDSAVKVSWKHDSIKDWESRELSVRNKEFPWKLDVQVIAVPNLLIGRMATLRCKISNVFPDALSVKWLKKDKDNQELFPVNQSQTYTISELRPEKQKDNTFTYTTCLKFKPSIETEEGVEFICKVEHPTLQEPAEKSTGPLTITVKKVADSFSQDKHQDSAPQVAQDVPVDGSVPALPPTDINTLVPLPQENSQQDSGLHYPQDVSKTDSAVGPTDDERFIVGEIRGPRQWIHEEKVTLYCSVSDCSENTQVMWTMEHTDQRVEEISNTGGNLLIDSDYIVSKETDKSDKEGLFNIISSLTLVPSVSKHLGVIIACKITSDGQTKTRKFQTKPINAKPKSPEPVKISLCDGGDILCSLNLQNLYPKHIKLIWKSGETLLKSKEEYEENKDHTYNVVSNCTVPGNLLSNPNFTLHVTWSHKSLEKPQSQVLSWRDPGLSWSPVIEEVPIPHVLTERKNTFQYNISGYFPDDVTVMWYMKKRGAQEYIPLSQDKKYQIPDIQSQRQSDLTYSCTARLLFTPILADEGSKIMCRVSHPSLESPIERGSGPLQVQAKPKTRKPIKSSLGTGEVIFSYMFENFYPKHIQIEWCYWSGEKMEQHCRSKEKCTPNLNKTFTAISEYRIPENLFHHPDFRVGVTWRHESMDEEEYKEFSKTDKAPEQQKPCIQHPQLHSGVPVAVSHHPSPQDVSNIIDHQHHPGVPAPEPHNPTPQNMSNLMDHPNHHSVQAPESQHSPQVVYSIEDHQHQTDASPLDPPHHSSQDVYNRTHHQNHPVQASESQHPYPQDVNKMLSHQHYPSAPAPESHHPPIENINNLVERREESDSDDSDL